MKRPVRPLLQRLAAGYVVDENGCWLWQQSLNWAGYGSFTITGQRMQAHRASYMLLIGPIPDGLDLDHLCRVRHCVNPEHLEPVTRSENLRRGNVGGWQVERIQECPQGHLYDEANTYTIHRRGHLERGCRKCRRAAARKHYLKNRAAA